jgi:hypothetical protein
MKIKNRDRPDFKDYLRPLRLLETSFRAAGLDIEFRPLVSAAGMKWVAIYYGRKVGKSACIEGDNPATAVKDVAATIEW